MARHRQQIRGRRTMNPVELERLVHAVARGEVEAASAYEKVLEILRAEPFADLGFARIDHHRAVRQGFPEVVLGLGKTPAQIAASAAEIVSRGSSLRVTRAPAAAYDAVRTAVPAATYSPEALLIALPQDDVSPGKGTIAVVAA